MQNIEALEGWSADGGEGGRWQGPESKQERQVQPEGRRRQLRQQQQQGHWEEEWQQKDREHRRKQQGQQEEESQRERRGWQEREQQLQQRQPGPAEPLLFLGLSGLELVDALRARAEEMSVLRAKLGRQKLR